MVRAQGAHELQLLGVVHPADLGPVQLGQLDGVHARAIAGPIDQHLLPGLDLSVVLDPLQRDGPRLGKGRGLLVGHAGGHRRQRSLRHADGLREPAHMTEDVCEHVLAWPEARRVAARRLHPSGDV
jgi:hypothetical protein